MVYVHVFADHSEDAVDLFFKSVAAEARHLPNTKRIKLQMDVMQLVASLMDGN